MSNETKRKIAHSLMTGPLYIITGFIILTALLFIGSIFYLAYTHSILLFSAFITVLVLVSSITIGQLIENSINLKESK